MKKVVVFDWGGIVDSHEDNFKDLNDAKIRLIRRYNKELSDDDILKRWTDLTSDGICIGSTNKEKDIINWVNLLQNNMNIKVPFNEFKKSYEEEYSKIKYYKDVVDYAHSLKSKCEIAILSNLGPFDKKRIDDQYKLSEFDHVYLSFEVGMHKPDKEIYEYVTKDLNISPKDILLIDDDNSNILAAKEYGWQTCLSYGYELDKIKASVDKFLK